MLYRKTILFLSALVLSLASGCTARYQDMLHERDARIRELNNEVAQLRGENDDLLRREQAAQAALRDASARVPEKASGNEVGETQRLVGDDAYVSYRRGRLSIGVNDSVTFASGSTELKGSANGVLRNIANVLKQQHTGKRIYVEGHTDNDPIVKTKDKYRSNRHLSAERADAVASYLILQGVPDSAITIVGYGQFDPLGGDKGKNRRVEVVIGDPIR
jgi:chemotaxis protein MotB